MADPDLVNGYNSFFVGLGVELAKLWWLWLGLLIIVIIKAVKERR